MKPTMTDRSIEILVNRRPKSAWSVSRRRESLTDDYDAVKHYSKPLKNLTGAHTDYPEESFDEVVEIFNKSKMELVELPSRFEKKNSRNPLKSSQRLKKDKNHKTFRILGKCQRLKENCQIDDRVDEHDNLNDELFNRSKKQFYTHQQKSKKPHETKCSGCESQEEAWDSLDEEIEAFNRERGINTDNGSRSTTASKKGKLKKRLHLTKTSSVFNDIPSDQGEEIILIEDITSRDVGLGQEGIPQCVKRSESKHVVAKRSYSDKGPSENTSEKKNSIKFPASYNAGDLLTLDFEAARRNIQERYGFCSKIKGYEKDSGLSQKILPNENDLNLGFYATKTLGDLSSRDLPDKEVYRPKTKLKPIKLRRNRPDENLSEQTNDRHLNPALLEALPSRLTNCRDQYSIPDLVTYDAINNGSQQQQSELLKKCSVLDENKGSVTKKILNQYLHDPYTSLNKGLSRRQGSKKSSHDIVNDYQHFVDVDLQIDSSNKIIRNSRERSPPLDRTSSGALYGEHSMVYDFSAFSMQNELSDKKTVDDVGRKYDDSVDADACLEGSSYFRNAGWNCQSITDFWQQTKKDFDSF